MSMSKMTKTKWSPVCIGLGQTVTDTIEKSDETICTTMTVTCVVHSGGSDLYLFLHVDHSNDLLCPLLCVAPFHVYDLTTD